MKDIVWHSAKISKENKETLLNQKACVLWFTGLSGSGKSTIAVELEKNFYEKGKYTVMLDGDNIRHSLCSDLGFSVEDRQENLRRIRETAKLFYENGAITIVSFISPFKQDRELARNLIGKDFIEIFIECKIEICEKRDPKGLYKKARAGEIKGFTGIDQEYEKPDKPEITINSDKITVEEAVNKIIGYLYGSSGSN
ncbi:MAG: adenylyl-sulfate kinase [Candidatus Melainabacteria bacterium GWF2_37_15]|nr:MAG: adenylyl-sulfate kinase [Candidatus Melainabacteria bacterium GWF2_37_15]